MMTINTRDGFEERGVIDWDLPSVSTKTKEGRQRRR
jgi:hypothetical protein